MQDRILKWFRSVILHWNFVLIIMIFDNFKLLYNHVALVTYWAEFISDASWKRVFYFFDALVYSYHTAAKLCLHMTWTTEFTWKDDSIWKNSKETYFVSRMRIEMKFPTNPMAPTNENNTPSDQYWTFVHV